MRVRLVQQGEDEVCIGVYLDSGAEIGMYCACDDPKAERRAMQKMLDAVVGEVQSERDKLRARVEKLERLLASSNRVIEVLEAEEDAREARIRERSGLPTMGDTEPL